MPYRIAKAFTFAASHQLSGLPGGHKCTRLHGHNYRVELELTGPPDEAGFVFDYGKLEPFDVWLKATVEHRHLNDVLRDTNPTAEHLALWFHVVASGLLRAYLPPGVVLSAVRVHETDKTTAEFRP